jgi:hypothetical protein
VNEGHQVCYLLGFHDGEDQALFAVQPLSDGPHQFAVRPGPDARLGVRRDVRAVQEAKAQADFCRIELAAVGLGPSRAMAALGSVFEYTTPR